MKITIGYFGTITTAEVNNRQQNVEYTITDGFADEKEVRAAVGNMSRDTYDYFYSGYHSDRKHAIGRMESAIRDHEAEIEKLKFAINATKKKDWVKL